MMKAMKIFFFTVRHLVDFEPLHGGSQEAWHIGLNVGHVVQLLCQRIRDINTQDLPVSLA